MDPYGRISIMQFFNYVMRKVWLHQTRIGLSLYDVAGQGYLKESVKPTENIQTTCIAYILKVPTLYMYNKDYFFHIFFYLGSRKLHFRADSNTASGRNCIVSFIFEGEC